MSKCSFCGKNVNDKNIILRGQFGDICLKCYEKGLNKIDNIKEGQYSNGEEELLKPHEIKERLDEYVIGQEETKKIISVEAYNHYKRIYRSQETDTDIQKTNMLITGPTGSGKTYLIEVLSRILNVPLIIGDATTITEAGYVGKDADVLIKALYMKANQDVKKAERGIIYIDEIDKIASKIGRSSEKDPSGEGAQQSLLKLLEGEKVPIEVNTPMGKTTITINTNNILFICGGAFTGINDIIKNRLGIKKSNTIGFNTGNADNKKKEKSVENLKVTSEDLVKFGLIEELVGRLPLITTLNKLTEKDLLNILTKSKNSIIEQYKALFKIDNVSLEFEEEALSYIVKEALKKNVGARGLRGIVADRMSSLMYEIPQKNIKSYKVTKEYLESNN